MMSENNIQMSDDITFEAAMTRLEEIVHELESGNAPLDKSLELFEEGVALVKICNTRLDDAEQRVNILVNDGGDIVEKQFAPMNNG